MHCSLNSSWCIGTLSDDDDGDEASFWSVLEDVEEGMEVNFYLFVMVRCLLSCIELFVI